MLLHVNLPFASSSNILLLGFLGGIFYSLTSGKVYSFALKPLHGKFWLPICRTEIKPWWMEVWCANGPWVCGSLTESLSICIITLTDNFLRAYAFFGLLIDSLNTLLLEASLVERPNKKMQGQDFNALRTIWIRKNLRSFNDVKTHLQCINDTWFKILYTWWQVPHQNLQFSIQCATSPPPQSPCQLRERERERERAIHSFFQGC